MWRSRWEESELCSSCFASVLSHQGTVANLGTVAPVQNWGPQDSGQVRKPCVGLLGQTSPGPDSRHPRGNFALGGGILKPVCNL